MNLSHQFMDVLRHVASSFFYTLNKDAFRVTLFFTASQQVALRLAAEEPEQLVTFGIESGDLMAEWASVFQPKRWSFGMLFADPAKPLRERTRAFAARWGYPAEFREAMG